MFYKGRFFEGILKTFCARLKGVRGGFAVFWHSVVRLCIWIIVFG